MLHANNISFLLNFIPVTQFFVRPSKSPSDQIIITDHRPENEKEYENSITKIIYSMFSYMKYNIHDFFERTEIL